MVKEKTIMPPHIHIARPLALHKTIAVRLAFAVLFLSWRHPSFPIRRLADRVARVYE